MALTAWQYADLTAKIEKKKEAIAKGPDKDSGGSQLAMSWYDNLIAFLNPDRKDDGAYFTHNNTFLSAYLAEHPEELFEHPVNHLTKIFLKYRAIFRSGDVDKTLEAIKSMFGLEPGPEPVKQEEEPQPEKEPEKEPEKQPEIQPVKNIVNEESSVDNILNELKQPVNNIISENEQPVKNIVNENEQPINNGGGNDLPRADGKRYKTFALFENLGANIKYYITQFNGVADEVPGAKEILSKLAVLEESFDNSGRKYLRDSNVKISKDSYNQLLSGMSSLFSEIDKFTSEDIKGTIGRDNKSIVFQFMAKECGAVLSDSFEKLSNVKYDETKLLEDNIGLSRKTIRVDLSKEKGFSGALNCWIPVKFTDRDGTVKEGFFNKNALGEGIRDAFDENGNPMVSMPINYEVRPGYMNKRNELATEFAEDLKLDYIAKAESVLIEDSAGNMVEGTFMETAKGSDIKHLDPNDPLLKCKNIAACSNPKFLKQIADIQVYDYLMDNFDRSEANVMYNVDYDSKGDPYIASVKCIDHDSTYFSAKNQGSQSYMAGPEDMRAISEHMAIKVMEIDPVSYRLKMASKGLTKPQMDAAFERLEVMKTQIRLAQTEPEKAAFKILSDDEFAKYTIKDFNDPSKFKFKNVAGSLKDCSMFNRVYNIARNDVTWPSPEGKHIDYCQGTLNDNEPKVSKEALMEYKIDLLKGLKELAAPEGHKRLTEYKAMKMGCTFAVAAIDQALQNASATGSDIISEGDKNKINRALKGLSEATNSFMYKSGSFTMAKDAIGMPIADATMSRYRKFAGMAKDVKDVALNYGKNDPGLNISREDKKQEYYRDVYNRLRECSNAFKANEAWHVKSSDDYMTLRKIVKACVEEPTWNKDRFSKEDMERFDKMFDQVKKASKIYYDKKVVRENKKQTARGQNRMKAVEKLIGQETVLENENKGFTLGK